MFVFSRVSRLFWGSLFGLSLSSAGWATSAALDVTALGQQIQAGQAEAAYQTLAPQEYDRAGDADYDYLLGLAALESGRPAQSTWALERVLASQPQHAGAQLDLARAYFALGQVDRAEQSFKALQAMNPPPAAKQAIERYLTAINNQRQQQQKQSRPAWTAYVETSAGHDSNITATTSDFGQGILSAYGLEGFEPTGNSVLRQDSYVGLSAGAMYNHPINDTWRWFAGANLNSKSFVREHDYNQQSVDVRWGMGHIWTEHLQQQMSLFAAESYQRGADDGTGNVVRNDRLTWGLNSEWQYRFNDNHQLSLQKQATHTRYHNSNLRGQDSDAFGLALNYLGAPEGWSRWAFFATLYWNRDLARNELANGSNTSKDSYGARLFGQYAFNEQLSLFTGLGWQKKTDRSEYARSVLIETGSDRQVDFNLGLNWQFKPQWSLRPQLSHSRNHSNISLYDFHRTDVSLSLRRDFE